MKLDRIQIAKILNVNKDALKQIERRGNLEKRLNKIGYELIKKTGKEKIFYFIREKKKEKFHDFKALCKYAYGTNKPKQFGTFFNIRTEQNNKAITNKELSETIEIGINTVTKWNNCLLDKGIIVKDGFFYFSIRSSDKKIIQCSMEEFNNYWNNRKKSRKREKIQKDYLEGKITLDEMINQIENYATTKFYIEGKYYYRIHKYKTNTDNKLYIDTKEIISILGIE